MISPLYLAYAALGGLIQVTAIYLMRAKDFPFWSLIPLILLHQYFFTTAYAKAPNFIFQWFITAALTSLASVVMGIWLFGDKVSVMNAAGVVLVFIGIAMMRLG